VADIAPARDEQSTRRDRHGDERDHGDRRLRKRWGCGWAGAGHVRMGSEES